MCRGFIKPQTTTNQKEFVFCFFFFVNLFYFIDRLNAGATQQFNLNNRRNKTTYRKKKTKTKNSKKRNCFAQIPYLPFAHSLRQLNSSMCRRNRFVQSQPNQNSILITFVNLYLTFASHNYNLVTYKVIKIGVRLSLLVL